MRKRPFASENATRAKLRRLSPERLADSLLKLAEQSDEAEVLVGRLTATAAERIQRFKSRLAAVRRRKRFIRWGETGAYARELRSLLDELRPGAGDPKTGVKLVSSFIRSDEAVFRAMDDSSGSVGDVFRLDAREHFVRFAVECEDKQWVADQVLELSRQDDYGVRDAVVEAAGEYLPEPVLRELAQRMWAEAEAEPPSEENDERSFRRQHWLILVGLLARQLRDPGLFERARRAMWPELGTAACIDIAEVYFESGDAETALQWLKRSEEKGRFKEHERDDLLQAVHAKLGNREEVERLAWKKFNGYRSPETLKALLSVIGAEQEQAVVQGAVESIQADEDFRAHDAAFLLHCDRPEDAEAHVLRHREQLDGDHYSSLLPLAEALVECQRPLAASLLYRALMKSILRRAISKYYHHAVRYLRILDRLAPHVRDWGEVPDHAAYQAGLRQAHKLKTSFWSRYEG